MDTQPTPTSSGERSGGFTPEDLRPSPSGEAAPTPEAAPAAPEVAPNPGQGGPAAPPPVQPPQLTAADVAAAIAAAPNPTPPAPAGSNVPLPGTAADVDVIEPEWVTKAESVVQQHVGDPYGEEEAIEELQQDYLKKRYGYDVTNPNAGNKPEGT